MIELEKAMLLVVLSLSGWSLFALLLDNRGQRHIHYCLAAILVSLCIPQLYFYTRLLAPPDGVFLLALLAQAVIWLKGPFLWLMVQWLVGRTPKFIAVHFVAFFAAVLWLGLDADALLSLGQAGLAHALIYSFVALKQLIAARPRLGRIYREFPNSRYFWLLWVVAGLWVVMLADFILMGLVFIHQILLLDVISVMSWCIALYLLSMAFCSVYRPAIFFHHNREPLNAVANEGEAITAALPSEEFSADSTTPTATEKSWRELDETLAAALAAQLEQLMAKDALYRQGELSLADLAARLNISAHQASELLNVHFGVAFYDYLNRYRLDYAAALLGDPSCNWRILDIIFEAGFSNKNSFYRCFKERYGITPAEFRQRQLSSSETASARV